jgi:pSer/pThr/pTyr-binding forkhead associated (FHA) protein
MATRPDQDDPEATSGGTREISVNITPFQSSPTPYSLRLMKGPGSPRNFLLAREEVVLGRSSEADIQVDSTDLSRKHLVLRREHGQYTVLDLDSRNGIYLNGVRIHSAVLHEGDNLQLGSVVLVYHEGRE